MHKTNAELLESAGLKKTAIRLEVMELLQNTNVLQSAQDIHLNLVKKDVPVNLSSIYRTLEKLVEVKIINQVYLRNDKHALYEFNAHSHHHFLVCDDCNKVVVVHECSIHDYEERLQKSHGFDITDHKIEFHGRCSDCRE